MSTISLAIQKGGSGKTTTAINLAAALQLKGKKVLLVDLDPQANLTHSLGQSEEPDYSIYHLLRAVGNGEEVDIKEIITNTGGIPIIPASIELAGAELELVRVYGREFLISQLLEQVKKEYDYIFIDCPPAIGMLTVNALAASDYVIMPMQAEYLHYKGLKSFLHHFKKIKKGLQSKLKILGIVLTKFDERKIMNREIYNQLREEFGKKVFATTIRTNIELAKAQEKGQDIFAFNPRCNSARDYDQLSEEFLKKIRKSKSSKK